MTRRSHYFQSFFLIWLFFLPINFSFAEQQKVTLAYLENGLSELNENEKQIALQLLANEIIKDSRLHMLIKPVSTFSEIKHLINKAEIDYVILNSFHYITHYDFLTQFITPPIWAIQRGPKERENYILVANKRFSGFKISQLRNTTISLHKQYLLMNFYLDYLVKKQSKQNSTQFFKRLNYTKTASKAVLDVYFGKSDVCIVPEHIYNLTIDLNPAIKQELAIIHQSNEQFLPVLFFNFKRNDSLVNSIVNNNISNISNTVRGQQILEMFNIEEVKRTTPHQLQPMRTLFNNYQALSTNE